jgi:hypothetical protein
MTLGLNWQHQDPGGVVVFNTGGVFALNTYGIHVGAPVSDHLSLAFDISQTNSSFDVGNPTEDYRLTVAWAFGSPEGRVSQ